MRLLPDKLINLLIKQKTKKQANKGPNKDQNSFKSGRSLPFMV